MIVNQITKRLFLFMAPVAAILAAWEIIASQSDRTAFLFGRPAIVAKIFWQRFQDGSLIADIAATLVPVVSGFVIGNLLGVALGLLLWRLPNLNQVARPLLIALGAIPAFVFAPVLVIWFGTGVEMKTVLVVLSTVLIAALQASTGASEIDPDSFRLFRSFRATNTAAFRHLVLPSAAAWVFAALRLNIGFALLGAFIGEFISSERGVAHRALVDAGLYNLSAVWASAFSIALMSTLLYALIVRLEAVLVPWKKVNPSREQRTAETQN